MAEPGSSQGGKTGQKSCSHPPSCPSRWTLALPGVCLCKQGCLEPRGHCRSMMGWAPASVATLPPAGDPIHALAASRLPHAKEHKQLCQPCVKHEGLHRPCGLGGLGCPSCTPRPVLLPPRASSSLLLTVSRRQELCHLGDSITRCPPSLDLSLLAGEGPLHSCAQRGGSSDHQQPRCKHQPRHAHVWPQAQGPCTQGMRALLWMQLSGLVSWHPCVISRTEVVAPKQSLELAQTTPAVSPARLLCRLLGPASALPGT